MVLSLPPAITEFFEANIELRVPPSIELLLAFPLPLLIRFIEPAPMNPPVLPVIILTIPAPMKP